MLKILIAVDGSEHARRAIEAVGKMVKSAFELEAMLICVNPRNRFFMVTTRLPPSEKSR